MERNRVLAVTSVKATVHVWDHELRKAIIITIRLRILLRLWLVTFVVRVCAGVVSSFI